MSKKLRAAVEWTEYGANVMLLEGFVVPPRTRVQCEAIVPLIPKPLGTIEEIEVTISNCICLDCGFNSESLDDMRQHQKNEHGG